MERLENQKTNDNEIHELLKQEILLKIENEKEHLKKKNIETENAKNELTFQQERRRIEIELLKENQILHK